MINLCSILFPFAEIDHHKIVYSKYPHQNQNWRCVDFLMTSQFIQHIDLDNLYFLKNGQKLPPGYIDL